MIYAPPFRSCVEQTGVLETVIIDNGSTDGTSEMVAEEFPDVRVVRNEKSTGYIVVRNTGANVAQGCIIFSIDDAVFTSPGVVGDVHNIVRRSKSCHDRQRRSLRS